MASNDDEEELLRSVALQNANSILAARQRAEKALLEAKESLEARTRELAHSISLLRATLEATNDAILVTDERDGILEFNEQFLELWKLPRDIVDNGRHRAVLEYNSRHFKDPESFLARVAEIYSSGQEVFDELWLEDGRVIERFSKIQYIDGETAGRVWSFRDISESQTSGGAEIATRGNRRIRRRRDCQQNTARHYHQLERRSSTNLWLQCGGGHRPVDHDADSAGSNQ